MTKKKVLISETLKELSERWRAWNDIPSGLNLTLVNKKNRQQRSDTKIVRSSFPAKSDDRSRLSEALDDLMNTLVEPSNDLTFVLRKPDKKNIPKNTILLTIREMDIEGDFPNPLVAEPALNRYDRDEQINEAYSHVNSAIFHCTQGINLSDEVTALATIRSLLKIIDRNSLLKALEEMGLFSDE